MANITKKYMLVLQKKYGGQEALEFISNGDAIATPIKAFSDEKLSYQKARKFLDELICPNDEQITKEIEYALKFYKNLKPMVFLSYDRLAYIGIEDENFRITFDRNIMWRNYDIDLRKEPYGKRLLDDDLVMMEIKTVMGYPRWLLDYLGKNNIYKTSFSKYGNVYKELMNEEQEEIKYA